MRGLRSTIALIVVLAGLGALHLFRHAGRLPETATPTRTRRSSRRCSPATKPTSWKRSRSRSAAGDATTLKKEGGGWQVTQPLAAKADESEVSGITTRARPDGSRPRHRREPGQPERLRAVEPAHPDRLQGRRRQGLPQAADRRQDANRLRSVREAQRREEGLPDPGLQETTLQPHDLRSAREGGARSSTARRSTASTSPPAARRCAVAKDGGDWKITKPVQTRADFGSVEGLVGRLRIGADEVDRHRERRRRPTSKKYGLDKPEATVNLNAGSARATLLIGGKAADNTVYARDASQPAVDHGRERAARRPEEERRRLSPQRTSSSSAPSTPTASRWRATARPSVLEQGRRARARTRPTRGTASARPPPTLDEGKERRPASKLSNIRAASFVDATAQDRPRQAGADGHGASSTRGSGRESDVRAGRQRRLRRASRRAGRGEDRRRRLQRARSNRSMSYRNNGGAGPKACATSSSRWSDAAARRRHRAPRRLTCPTCPTCPTCRTCPDPPSTATIDAILAQPALQTRLLGRPRQVAGERRHALRDERAQLAAAGVDDEDRHARRGGRRRLGWDYRYETTVRAAGSIDAGVLEGDLMVVRHRRSRAWSPPTAWPTACSPSGPSALKQRGIRTIAGRIIGDDNALRRGDARLRLDRGTTCRTTTPRASARCSSTRTPCASRIAPGPAAGDSAAHQPSARGQRPDDASTP